MRQIDWLLWNISKMDEMALVPGDLIPVLINTFGRLIDLPYLAKVYKIPAPSIVCIASIVCFVLSMTILNNKGRALSSLVLLGFFPVISVLTGLALAVLIVSLARILFCKRSSGGFQAFGIQLFWFFIVVVLFVVFLVLVYRGSVETRFLVPGIFLLGIGMIGSFLPTIVLHSSSSLLSDLPRAMMILILFTVIWVVSNFSSEFDPRTVWACWGLPPVAMESCRLGQQHVALMNYLDAGGELTTHEKLWNAVAMALDGNHPRKTLFSVPSWQTPDDRMPYFWKVFLTLLSPMRSTSFWADVGQGVSAAWLCAFLSGFVLTHVYAARKLAQMGRSREKSDKEKTTTPEDWGWIELVFAMLSANYRKPIVLMLVTTVALKLSTLWMRICLGNMIGFCAVICIWTLVWTYHLRYTAAQEVEALKNSNLGGGLTIPLEDHLLYTGNTSNLFIVSLLGFHVLELSLMWAGGFLSEFFCVIAVIGLICSGAGLCLKQENADKSPALVLLGHCTLGCFPEFIACLALLIYYRSKWFGGSARILVVERTAYDRAGIG